MATWKDRVIPIMVALISAGSLLAGYSFQKGKEREFEMDKVRRELYSRLVANYYKRVDFVERQTLIEPGFPMHLARGNIKEFLRDLPVRHPALAALVQETRELMTLMSLYASDDALKATAVFMAQADESLEPGSKTHAEVEELLLALRRTMFPRTEVTADEIRLITDK